MDQIISIDEYRNVLIEYYKYNYDKDTYELRKRTINNSYDDEYLKRIINDTREIYEILLETLKKEGHTYEDKVYISIDIEEENINISNGCIGGWHSDTIYIFYVGNREYYISNYILNLFFKGFDIYVHEDIIERMEDECIGSFIPIRKLFIRCKKDIYESFIKESDILKLEYKLEQ